MEDLLGINAGDFEGVAFADSDEEEPASTAGCAVMATGAAGPSSQSDNNDSNGHASSITPPLPERTSRTTVGAPRTDFLAAVETQARGGDSDKDFSGATVGTSSSSVGVERGAPLPEHACAKDSSLSLLRRVERCCIESNSSEIEFAITLLTSTKPNPDQSDNVTAAGVIEKGKKDSMGFDKGVFLGFMSPREAEAASSACRAALLLCRGEYEQLLQKTPLFALQPGSTTATARESGYSAKDPRASVRSFVVRGVRGSRRAHESSASDEDVNCGGDGEKEAPLGADVAAVWRAAEAMWVGAAALSLFWQENYSGPELGPERLSRMDAFVAENVALGVEAAGVSTQDAANIALACDGELPYPKSGLAGLLLAARMILTTLTEMDPHHVRRNAPGHESERLSSWSANLQSVKLSDGDKGRVSEEEGVFRVAAGGLSTAAWWAARACVAHARLLLSSDRSKTLWREAIALFGPTVRAFGGGVDADKVGTTGLGARGDDERMRRRVAGRVWLEWGLAQHYFQDPAKGKESFVRAKAVSGLTAALTGALGKRTKHQQSQVAQLVLIASSAYAPEDMQEPEKNERPGSSNPPIASSIASSTAGEDNKRLASAAVGEEAAVVGAKAAIMGPELGVSTTVEVGESKAAARRTVHAEDSALLEDVSFVQKDLEHPSKLEDIDLAIILGLCLDVSNSNPRDGLTNEEMTPYIARVLRQPGCNWMIYSTALLQRAWVEFERSHARDRAALQLQALLDQHTTKLTYTQSTAQSIEESAPAHERLRYLSSLSFPPRWELRKDLAQRYAGMGVLGSAAAEFVELEMWEEAVECYRHMQQVNKAERLARDRLEVQETPPMLAALGDLTQDPELWERAWKLSGGRYARAKVSLGRMHLREAKYEEACGQYEQALAVKPLMASAWFSLGVARMRLGRWSEALRAFSTVVQQEPEEGEAWGNMGAVHMHEGNWSGASAAFSEGLKYMPTNWRMWENHAEALLRLGRWSSAVYACHRLLDLSDKSKKGVEVEFLAILVEGAFRDCPGDSASSSPSPPPQPLETGAVATGPGVGDDLTGRGLWKQVAELLGRLVSSSSTRGDPRVWEVYARFNEGAGRDRSKVLDCVAKQCRAIQKSGWEKDARAVERLASASDKLVKLYLEDGTRQSVYQAKMHLASATRKVKVAEVCAGCPGHERLLALLHRVEGILAELVSRAKER